MDVLFNYLPGQVVTLEEEKRLIMYIFDHSVELIIPAGTKFYVSNILFENGVAVYHVIPNANIPNWTQEENAILKLHLSKFSFCDSDFYPPDRDSYALYGNEEELTLKGGESFE